LRFDPRLWRLRNLHLIMLLVVGCSVAEPHAIRIESMADSNQSSAIAVDLVAVNDPVLTSELKSLSGPDWFERRAELLAAHADRLSVVSLQIVPADVVTEVERPSWHRSAETVLLFANYLSPAGQHASVLTGYKQLLIRFERDSYQLIESD